ncbi:MAG: hypothetical protein QM725_02650 [Lacibacter sp.]
MKKLIYSILLIIFGFASCKRDTNVFVPDAGQQLDSAWTANVTASNQVLILSKQLEGSLSTTTFNSADTLLSTNAGVQFIFPKNSLTVSGTATSGTVKTEYILVQKKGDFIRYGIPTVYNRLPLESGGAIHIKLTSNNQVVTLADYKKITIKYKDSEPKSNMRVFYGNSPVITNSLDFSWLLATDQSLVKVWDSSTFKGYAVETYKTGWINVDRPLLDSINARVEVKAYLPNLFSNANTAVYVVFNNYKTVVQLSGNSTGRYFSFPNIPPGPDVKFISISKVGGSYYLGVKAEKISPTTAVFIKPELTTMPAIQSFLNSL